MPVIPPVAWSDILPGMQTGDIMLFSGSDTESEAIELMTMSEFSHAVMIYRADDTTDPWIWEESSLENLVDPISHTIHPGAQAGDALQLAEMIAGRGNLPYYRPLLWERPSDLNANVLAFMEKWDGTPFGAVLDMGWDWIEGHYFGVDSGRSHMFCAMLLALTYQTVGLLDTTHPPNYYAPGSFSPASDDVVLQLGASYGALTPVTFG